MATETNVTPEPLKRFRDSEGDLWIQDADNPNCLREVRDEWLGMPKYRDVVARDFGPLIEVPAEMLVIDAAVEVAARAIQAYQARHAFPPEQYTWEAIPQEWRGRHLASARVMVEAVMPLLAAEREEFKALAHGYNEQWRLASGMSRIFEGRADWLYHNTSQDNRKRFDDMVVADYDFAQHAATNNASVPSGEADGA